MCPRGLGRSGRASMGTWLRVCNPRRTSGAATGSSRRPPPAPTYLLLPQTSAPAASPHPAPGCSGTPPGAPASTAPLTGGARSAPLPRTQTGDHRQENTAEGPRCAPRYLAELHPEPGAVAVLLAGGSEAAALAHLDGGPRRPLAAPRRPRAVPDAEQAAGGGGGGGGGGVLADLVLHLPGHVAQRGGQRPGAAEALAALQQEPQPAQHLVRSLPARTHRAADTGMPPRCCCCCRGAPSLSKPVPRFPFPVPLPPRLRLRPRPAPRGRPGAAASAPAPRSAPGGSPGSCPFSGPREHTVVATAREKQELGMCCCPGRLAGDGEAPSTRHPLGMGRCPLPRSSFKPGAHGAPGQAAAAPTQPLAVAARHICHITR